MSEVLTPASRARVAARVLHACVGLFFFGYLFSYYLTGSGGPTLLALTMVPVTFILFVLEELQRDGLYPRLGRLANWLIGAVYIAICVAVSIYMNVEFIELGTARAGSWNATDLTMGGLMALLVLEYSRQRYFVLFVINLLLIVYAVYGSVVPGMFFHAGLSWERIVSAMSVEEATGVFSRLPQLALTLIGSFVLVLSVLRAFGCVDSILKGATQISKRSPHALPQAAVVGSLGVAAVSGSGAANAVTTGSATIPAMIGAGLARQSAAAIEASASLGGQLMPPIMGISAFLMAEFMGVSYFDVVARGYVPALIYFFGISASVYLISLRHQISGEVGVAERMHWIDWSNLLAFVCVVGGLILLMAIWHSPPMFAALDIFLTVGGLLLLRHLYDTWRRPEIRTLADICRPLLRFLDTFTTMTADLTLLLATLSILTGAMVITGVPTKVGFLLLDAAGINIAAMAIVAFLFGALLGAGLPPAPTYILTALVIAPPMIKAGVDPWAVHFFAFFLAVWGELTPPTSVVAAVTAKIAETSFIGTLFRAILICSSLFVLMAAMFSRPELVLEPGAAQFGAAGLVLVATLGLVFCLQAQFSPRRGTDLGVRGALALLILIVLFHPDLRVAGVACIPILLALLWWLIKRGRALAAAAA